MKDGDYYIWTHKKLEIGYNGNRIVDINLTSDSKVKLEKDKTISFSYEVHAVILDLFLQFLVCGLVWYLVLYALRVIFSGYLEAIGCKV